MGISTGGMKLSKSLFGTQTTNMFRYIVLIGQAKFFQGNSQEMVGQCLNLDGSRQDWNVSASGQSSRWDQESIILRWTKHSPLSFAASLIMVNPALIFFHHGFLNGLITVVHSTLRNFVAGRVPRPQTKIPNCLHTSTCYLLTFAKFVVKWC